MSKELPFFLIFGLISFVIWLLNISSFLLFAFIIIFGLLYIFPFFRFIISRFLVGKRLKFYAIKEKKPYRLIGNWYKNLFRNNNKYDYFLIMQKGVFAVKLFNIFYSKGMLEINNTYSWVNTKIIPLPTPVGTIIPLSWPTTLTGCPGIINTIKKIQLDFAVKGLPSTALVPFINFCPRCSIIKCFKRVPTTNQKIYGSFYKTGKGLTRLIHDWPVEFSEDDSSIFITPEECNIKTEQFDEIKMILKKYI